MESAGGGRGGGPAGTKSVSKRPSARRIAESPKLDATVALFVSLIYCLPTPLGSHGRHVG